MKKVSKRVCCASGMFVLSASVTAFAQGQLEDAVGSSASSRSVLEEVLVRAQKRVQSVNDVPISIDTVSGDDIRSLGIVDTESLARVVPGFVATNTYFGTPVYYLRGVGYLDTAIAARPAVALYSNEVPLPFAATTLGSTLDLEQVEVLKGPQGTLFGSNATGGAINFLAARPTEEFAAEASVSYGRFNELNADGFVSGALGNSLRGRFALAKETMSEWQQSKTTSRENGARDVTKGRLSIDFDATDDLLFQFTASGTMDQSDSIAPQYVGNDPTVQPQHPDFVAFPFADLDDAREADWSTFYPDGNSLERDDWTWQLSLRADYAISESMNLTSITAYTEAGIDRGYDADGTTVDMTNLSVTGEVESFFQELRVWGETTGGMNYVIGANFQRDESEELVTFYLPEGRNGLVFSAVFGDPSLVIDLVPEIAIQETDAWAVFGNMDFPITDTLTGSVGLRYTDTQTDFSGCALAGGNLIYANSISIILGVNPPPGDGDCATFTLTEAGYVNQLVENNLAEDNVSWRVGVDWKPNLDSLYYASVSRGYKAGSFSNISAVFAEQYQPVPEEELTAYEIGAKLDLSKSVHLNGAAFYYDYKDKQQQGTVIVPVFNTLTALVSIPESRVQGVELDLTIQATEGLRLGLAGVYLDAEVSDTFNGTTVFGAAADFDGSSFPNTPEWQANASLDYRWSLSSGLDAFANLHVTHRTDTNSDFVEDPRLDVDAYTLVDAILGIAMRDQKWRAEIWGRNLTDEVYTAQIVRRQEAIVRTVGMPRTYGIRFTYQF